MPRLTSIALVTLASASLAHAQSWGVWQQEADMPTGGLAKTHAVGLEHNGTLYALGGPPWLNPPNEDGTVYSLPLGGIGWTEELGFDGYGYTIRQGGGVDGLGRIVIFGGDNPDEPGANDKLPFEWDSVEGPWHDLAARGASAPLINFAYCTDELNRIYSIGGGTGSTYCERYVGTLDSWEPIAPMPVALANCAATIDGLGHILVLGGFDASVRTTEVLQYDIATNTWASTANAELPVALTDHRAALGSDGRVYVIGGVSDAGTTERSTYVYNPLTDEWQTGPLMAEARRNFAVVAASDSRIYVMGGENAAGGTAGVESLYTTLCPVITIQPEPTALWENTTLVLPTATTGGTPITFQWYRDGVALTDGPPIGGGTISGATSATLTIDSVGADDAGYYTIVASNACGDTTSTEAFVDVRVPPAIPTSWTFTSLHPSYAESSFATGVDNGVQVGRAVFDTPDYNNIDHPTKWTGTAASAVNLTPAGSQGGSINDIAGDKMVGWWWQPLSCYVGGQWLTCYYRRGGWWNTSTGAFHETSYSGFEYTTMSATDGISVVGSGTTDDDVGNYFTRAVIWGNTDHWYANSIHPSGYADSSAAAVDGDFQFGTLYLPFAVVHAGMWEGSAASAVDMHPAGHSNSSIVDASEGQQVGVLDRWGTPHAAMWTGSPETFRIMTPSGASTSSVIACEGGLQLGGVDYADGTGSHPGLWSGGPDTFTEVAVDLPPDYASFSLAGLDVASDGTVTLVGSAYNAVLSRSEAMLLTPGSTGGCAADLTGDGNLNVDDIDTFVNAFLAADLAADFDSNGALNVDDIDAYVTAFLNGC